MSNQVQTVETAKALLLHLQADVGAPENAVWARSYAEWDLALKNLADTGELDDANVLHVDVVSHSTEQQMELAARGGENSVKLKFNLPIDICVRKKLSDSQQDESTGRIQVEEIDRLQLFTQQLHVACTQRMLPSFAAANWQRTQLLVAPAHDLLRQYRQYTSIIRIAFDVYQEFTVKTK